MKDRLLDKINYPSDVKSLAQKELPALCAEIRDFLIENISQTGGHLASNLGAVEISVGLHRIFDCPIDNIIFDVGHQSYVHKILTGRKNRFLTLRKLDGLSGFQRPDESPYDCFVTGHASNSVSAALGMARARTLEGRHNEVICVIGDGALTGGMAYEALNDAGQSGEKMIVVFNDNEMSISKNVGAIANRLSHIRSKPNYLKLKTNVKSFFRRFESGEKMIRMISGIKARLRKAILKESIFEILGFKYLGPADGNDMESVCALLQEAKRYNGPVVVHFKTIKGKGYHPSETCPWNYHSVSPFDPVFGVKTGASPSFSSELGHVLCGLALTDSRICAVTAAMEDGTGLGEFSLRFPSRFFDVGIAEGHAVAMSSGLVSQGARPVFAVYSSFLQRGYDQLIHDVAIAGNHVVFAVDRAGLVGADGETHQGMFDVPYLLSVPGIKLYSPSSFAELGLFIKRAIYNEKGPVAVRFPRGGQGEYVLACADGVSAETLEHGNDVTLVSYGIMINNVLKAARLLKEQGQTAEIIKINELSSFDMAGIIDSVKKTGRLIVAEDCAERGSVGEKICRELMEMGCSAKTKLINLGMEFIPHGNVEQLYEKYGLNAENIAKKAGEMIG